MTSKPTFIIMIGPAGSGKGYILPYIINSLYQNLDRNNFKSSLIDDLIESNQDFIDMSSDCVRKNYSLEELNSLENNIDKIIDAIMNDNKENQEMNKLIDTSKELTDIYFAIRESYHFDKINDNLIKKYIDDSENIVFETTGFGNIKWIFDDTYIGKNKYNVIMVYPYVNNYDVIRQALSRFINQAKKIILSNKNHWCRLPNLTMLYNSISNIQDNIIALLNECIDNKIELEYFLLYDNRPKSPEKPVKIIFQKCTDGKLSHDNLKNIHMFSQSIADNTFKNKMKLIKGGNKATYTEYIKTKKLYSRNRNKYT